MTHSDEVRFRTITRTRLHALPDPAQETALLGIYRDNAERLGRGFRFCRRHGISLFRMSSDLFPHADTPLGLRLLGRMADELARLGREAAGLRLTMHPDQFVVLSSDRPDVVRNSVAVLEVHALVMDLLGLPRSPWAAINVHGGKGGRGPALAERVRALPDSVRTRLTLENDERAYGATEIAAICSEAGVPMVFDAHLRDQVAVRPVGELRAPIGDVHELPGRIRPGRSRQQQVPQDALVVVAVEAVVDDVVVPACYRSVPYIDVEAKAKEVAISALRRAGW